MIKQLALATFILASPQPHNLISPQLNITKTQQQNEPLYSTDGNNRQQLYKKRNFETIQSENFKFTGVGIEKQSIIDSPYTTGKYLTEIELRIVTIQENTHTQNESLNLTSYVNILNNYLNVPIGIAKGLTYSLGKNTNLTNEQKNDLNQIIEDNTDTTYELSVWFEFLQNVGNATEAESFATATIDETIQNINNGNKTPITTNNTQGMTEKLISEDYVLNYFRCRLRLNEIDNLNNAQLYPSTMSTNMTETNIQAMWALTPVQENIDLAGLLFELLGMPFAWISTAFNVTLFTGTPYAINISRLIMGIIGTLIAIIILKKLIK